MSENINFTSSEISELIKRKIENLNIPLKIDIEGTVISVKDGIICIDGLTDIKLGEIIEFSNGTLGLSLNLERDSVSAIALGTYYRLYEGQKCKRTGNILEIPVGNQLLGRVVNALGYPIDGKGIIQYSKKMPIEKIAPGVIKRKSVSYPLQTGLKSIDSMVPIGLGQRELIIGDRQTGKTTIAIDTIINQKDKGIKCIYVSIGQKYSSIASIVNRLEEHGAMEYTIVVASSASEPAALQFIAPYSGCTIGEYFMENGENALIIYDDLTKHAWVYRQISLLLRRPPGREAYPGDIFYLHSRLLERSAQINELEVERLTDGKIKGKTGSLTALPIIETQSGDVSSFIPTNIISITDGQIFLDTDLFNAGIRPAINSGLSVSRVGSAAQTEIIKVLSSGIRLSLAQFRELEAFSQFTSDLDQTTRMQIERGKRIIEIMKQKQYSPLCIFKISLSLFAVEHGYLDNIPIHKINTFESNLHTYVQSHYKQFMLDINNYGKYDKDIEKKFSSIIGKFKNNFFIQ